MTESNNGKMPEGRCDQVLAAYLEAIDAGWAPQPRELIARYPDLADELEEYFRDQARFAPASARGTRSGRGTTERNEGPIDGDALTLSLGPPLSDPLIAGVGSFGDYELRGEISRGGMGVVFEAYERRLDRQVALKMIRAGEFASPEAVVRFLDEARHTARLAHPNIVPVHDCGSYRGHPYYTMKLVEGGDLNQYIQQHPDDIGGMVRMLVKVARTVQFAHERGVLHRDLKPANILLDKGEPLVGDFGLARQLRPLPAGTTPGGADAAGYLAPEQVQADPAPADAPGGERPAKVMGTPGYMPPEEAAGRGEAPTTAADVYGLGAVLYKVLTGHAPFRGADVEETLKLVREQAPLPPRRVNPRIDRDLEAVCLKCLEKQPGRRYASAVAFAQDLDRWLRREPVAARRRSWPARAGRAARRNAVPIAATTVAGFAAGVAFILLYWLDPQRTVEANERELVQGRAVTLVGNLGPPRYSRPVPNEDLFLDSRSALTPYHCHSPGLGRTDLMPRVPVPAYRFSAQVRHDQVIWEEGAPAPVGETGIYFAHAIDGDQSSCFELLFADRGHRASLPGGRKQGKSFVLLQLEHLTPGQDPKLEQRQIHLVGDVRKSFRAGPGTWRTLAVEVRPGNVRAFWGEGDETVSIGEVSTADLQTLGRDLLPATPHAAPPRFTYNSSGSLGLFVTKGTASFRRVIVEPLQ